MKYQEKLKDPRWQKKRLEVLQADDFKCVNCQNDVSTLHAHHLFYKEHANTWEYHTGSIVTLCAGCHALAHNQPLKELARMAFETLLRSANGIEAGQLVKDLVQWESDFKKKIESRMKYLTTNREKKR